MGKSRKVVRKDNEKGGSRKHRQRARDSDKDSAEDFVTVPDYPGLRAKNVTAAKKRSVNKLVRTQSNKWINIFGKAPTLETFVDKNIANYIAKGFYEHPNPSQRKSTLSFLKHMSQRLGIVHFSNSQFEVFYRETSSHDGRPEATRAWIARSYEPVYLNRRDLNTHWRGGLLFVFVLFFRASHFQLFLGQSGITMNNPRIGSEGFI
jgi:hypothetical protein